MNSDRLSTAVLYGIFFSTGMAVVLPGTLLPFLSRNWHMGDGTAGIFFLCFSVGSSGGALLARGNLARALTAGCSMTAAGAMLLARDSSAAVQAVIALYGCGLGLSMTSVSLLRSRRWPKQRIAEFARLNLTWAIGASCGPALLLRSAVRFGTGAVLHVEAGIFLFLALLALSTVPDVRDAERSGQPAAGRKAPLRTVPLALLCLISLATGVEGGLNSWLSSYMMRGGYVLGITISATTAFGVGIVASRMWHSRRGDAARSARVILNLHPGLMFAAILLLILSRSPWLSVACAFFAGVGVGPMYPLTLALQLSHKQAGNAGFIAGGAGASVVPMITGAVASSAHSLRAGLCVPLVAAAAILTLCTRMSVPGRSSDSSGQFTT
jgi:fucose permease